MSNILMLTGSLFMLEVYDRVLPSRSVPTLVGLVILAAGLYTAQGLLDLIRGRILVRIGAPRRGAQRPGLRDDRAAAVEGRQPQRRAAAAARSRQHPLVPVGLGPDRAVRPALDAVYLVDLLSFPSLIGLAALVGAIILGIITMLTEIMTREPTRAATSFAHGAQRRLPRPAAATPKSLTAMGMTSRIAALWSEANTKYLASQRRASDVARRLRRRCPRCCA